MQKLYIDKEHIFEFVRTSRVPLKGGAHLRSRCIDGRYENAEDLPAFTFPGADAGELLLIIAASREYGFEYKEKELFSVIAGLAGGLSNLQFHTDEHAAGGAVMAGCGHIGQMKLDPQAYGVTDRDVQDVITFMEQAKAAGANQTVLHGDHSEGVVVFVKGPYGVLPQADILVDNRRHHVQAFVYHQSLADTRHRLLAQKLIGAGAVTIPDGCDESYLYQVFADIAEDHLMETLKRLAKGLPIYEAKFMEDGLFEIEDLGIV